MELTLQELAAQVGGVLHGEADHSVTCVATIQNATADSITFLSNRNYFKYLEKTRAGCVVLSEADLEACPVSAIVVENPYLAYAQIAGLLNPVIAPDPGVHASAVVAQSAKIDPQAHVAANATIGEGVSLAEGVYIGPGCVLEDNVAIGAHTRIVANVTLCHDVSIGARCIIHPGTVIGADGFGIANDKGEWIKVPQLGSVKIDDDVEIGANTTVDRGALEDTIIERGVKLDNQIQVAHNVIIGEHTAVAGCVGIAGSTRIGKYCAIGGAAMIVGHLEIVDKVQVTAGSLVLQSIKEPGLHSSGVPLQTNKKWHRNYARFRQLDEMAKRIQKLEQQQDK